MNESCGSCKFYLDRDNGRSGYGKCRRYPVAVEVNDGKWCGEYTAKNPNP